MERPAKRQRLSPDPPVVIIPSRTIDLNSFQRPQNRRRYAGKILLPRVPDVTITSAILEVAVNGGSTTTQIAAPTTDIAVTLNDLGTVTIPAISTAAASAATSLGVSSDPSSASKPASASESILVPDSIVTSTNRNSTTFSAASGNTVTIFATSTLQVSYTNGSFLPVTTTKKPSSTKSASQDDSGDATDSDSDSETSSETETDLNSSRSASRYYSKHGTSETSSVGATATGSDSSYYNNNNNNNAAVGATGTETGTAIEPASSSNTDSGIAPPILSPQQTRMVGGIVGGIAGVAMILIVLLYVLRWYRERLKKQGRLPQQLASSHSSRDFGVSGLIGCAAPMSQSRTALFPVAAGPGMKKWRPGSDVTTLTNATSISAGNSERGFHRVSGRKIPSVLTTGGDQFGGSYGAFEKESGTLFRTATATPYFSDTDSAHGYTPPHRPASRSTPSTPVYPTVFAGEATAFRSPSATSPRPFGSDEFRNAFGRNVTKPDGIAVYHSSPARTPVMQSPNTSTLRFPSQAPVTMDEDIPDMPLPSPGLSAGMHNIGIAIGTGGVGGARIPGGTLSSRNGASNGRFRENMGWSS